MWWWTLGLLNTLERWISDTGGSEGKIRVLPILPESLIVISSFSCIQQAPIHHHICIIAHRYISTFLTKQYAGYLSLEPCSVVALAPTSFLSLSGRASGVIASSPIGPPVLVIEKLSFSKNSFSENYRDCLSDVKAATALQPSYLKAIIRGENESQ